MDDFKFWTHKAYLSSQGEGREQGQHAEIFLNSTAHVAGWPPSAKKTMREALSFMLFLKASLKQPGWSSFSICKARRNLRPHSPVFCPAQLEAACTEAAGKGSSRWSVLLQIFMHHPLNQSQDRAVGLERWEILQKTVPHIHHVLQNTLHKAGDMSVFQLKKPEQPSAEELGIREEIHWFRLFTHTRKEKYLFWCPYYCSDQEVVAVRRPRQLVGVWSQDWALLGQVSFLPRESLGAWTVLFVGRRNVPLPERDSKKGQFWTVSEELQPLLVERLRESSSTATSHVPAPSSTDPLQGRISSTQHAYSKDFHSLLQPSKALTKKRIFLKKLNIHT